MTQGSAQHYVAMADRTEGRPPQAISLGGALDLNVENAEENIRIFTQRIRDRIARGQLAASSQRGNDDENQKETPAC
jgi:hypothetical protein